MKLKLMIKSDIAKWKITLYIVSNEEAPQTKEVYREIIIEALERLKEEVQKEDLRIIITEEKIWR